MRRCSNRPSSPWAARWPSSRRCGPAASPRRRWRCYPGWGTSARHWSGFPRWRDFLPPVRPRSGGGWSGRRRKVGGARAHPTGGSPGRAAGPVRDVEHAGELVDGLPYALTGGLFARDPATVRYDTQRSPVGNLYINRGITGAMVGRQPFGGNRLSGTGSKAGGPDYLRHFVEPRAVTENTMRHGLVV